MSNTVMGNPSCPFCRDGLDVEGTGFRPVPDDVLDLDQVDSPQVVSLYFHGRHQVTRVCSLRMKLKGRRRIRRGFLPGLKAADSFLTDIVWMVAIEPQREWQGLPFQGTASCLLGTVSEPAAYVDPLSMDRHIAPGKYLVFGRRGPYSRTVIKLPVAHLAVM